MANLGSPRRSEHAKRFEQKDPQKHGRNTHGRGGDHDVAGELGIAAHLLRHGEGVDGGRRGENADERHERHAPEAEQRAQAEKQPRRDDQLGGRHGHQLTAVGFQAGKLEKRAEQEQLQGRRDGADVLDGLLEDVRQADAGGQRQDAEHGADDERVFRDLAEDVQRLRLLPAEHLQHDDGQHIEQRHDDRDQDRDGAELVGAEQRRRHGDAHDDVVAAEHALDHHAAALWQLFGQQRVAEREAERQQHAAHGIGHQQRVKRAGQVGAIYIIIKQTR